MKKSKRLLALILSVLMVLTSLPVVAFTAFAADVDDVNTAMRNYEAKMDGTIYKNMGAAYEAYVNCQKALDAYNYGGSDYANALSGKAAALEEATKNMQAWTAPVFDAKAYHYKDEATDGYSNVVYTTGSPTTEATVLGESTDAGITAKIFVPALIVLAYDGKNEASLPAQLETSLPGKTFCSKQSIHYAASSDSKMYFDDVWNGYMNGSGDKWKTWAKKTINSTATLGAQSSDTSHTQTPNKTSRFWWNKLAYHGSGNITNYYDKFTNSSLAVYCYFDNWGDKYTTLTPTAANEIYVINYKPVADAITDCTSKLATALNGHKMSEYKQGGMSSLLAAFDKATVNEINPKNYSYASTEADVQTCSNAIKSFVSSYTAPSAATVDEAGYQNVREAMDTNLVKTRYNGGLNGWTDESWARFETAYNAARTMMVAPYDGGSYSATNGVAVADELLKSCDALEFKEKNKVDTTALVNAINKFKALQNIFTQESFDASLAVVDNAITTVWGSAEHYGMDYYAPVDDDAGTAKQLITNQTAAVEQAIRDLRISADTIVTTASGNYSLNQVITLTKSDSDKYWNWVDFTNAVDAAKQYRNTLALTEFTDFDTQYAAYTAEVEKVLKAYNELEYGLMDIPDNTVYGNNSVTTMKAMSADDHGAQSIAPTYTNHAVVIKTTHDTSNVTFGKFSIDHMTNVTNKEGNVKGQNLGIDSISINATASAVSANDRANFLTIASGTGDKLVPGNMGEEKNTTYPGVLSYNGFTVSNLHLTGFSSNWNSSQYITDASGNRITDRAQAMAYNLDSILGTTDGSAKDSSSVVNGVVFNHSSSGDAHIYIDGDFSATVKPSDAVANLAVNTTPRMGASLILNTNFGAVTNHAMRNMYFYSARCWFTSASNNEKINTIVEVVDISYLKDLIDLCNTEYAPYASKYTPESFAAFSTALKDAQAAYHYQEHTAQEFVNYAKEKYTELWNKKEALEPAQYTVTFNYKNADGTDAVVSIPAEYGQTIADIKDQINAIVVPDYTADGMTYTFKSWSPAVVDATEILGNLVYTAVYDSFSSVDWTAYDIAQTQLINDLTNGKYTKAGLLEIQTDTNDLFYFTATAEEKGKVTADKQDAVDAEAAKLAEIDAKLAGMIADTSVYDALLKTIDTLNADAYDTAQVEAVVSSTEASTDVIIGGVAYKGWDVEFFNTAVATAMNESTYKYTVIIYDINGNAYYVAQDGTTLVAAEVDSSDNVIEPADAGHFKYGDVVTATNPVTPGNVCTFDVNILAHNTDTPSINKYACSSTEYQFNVRGNTEISTNAGETTDYKISFIDGRNGRLVYTYYTNSNRIMGLNTISGNIPEAPFYSIVDYTNVETGATVKPAARITLTSQETTFKINYGAREQEQGYSIILLDDAGNTLYNGTHNWNDKVTLTAANDAAGMVDDNGNVVAYGSEYSFYACQSITLHTTDTVDGNVHVSVAAPVTANGNVYFTGSFAKEGFDRYNDKTVKGYGIVIDTSGRTEIEHLTLKDVNKANKVFNLSSSSLTCGNQFTVYTGAPQYKTSVYYRAYVIYEINGVETIEYSDIIQTTIG